MSSSRDTNRGPARIAPSILAADFARLGEEIATVAPHVDMLHIDVMDGHFVPNVSLGLPVIRSIRPLTELLFDCHLMMTNADGYFDPLREVGADLVTIHIEAYPDPTRAAARARELGLGFGLVLNPPTPIAAVEPFLDLCDLVLVMSVHPGFGGQAFIPETLAKVRSLRETLDRRSLAVDIQIDGGIDPDTIGAAREAGADVFVAGSAIFGAADPVAAVEALRRSAEG
ncbi:MAG: ribulose-phosphate 3-epimerase [Actinomycetota bacterium]|nr:ribulose-phosphate 3-epimerase [Actinomycetota bacterium]